MSFLDQTAHRPWPYPKMPWIGKMTWYDLLFMHWPVLDEEILPHIPDGLTLDKFDGQAWIGIVPFGMKKIRLTALPYLPGANAFLELNVRTYVTVGGKAGVFFFSLDAENPLAVFCARHFVGLPYFNATMKKETEGDWIEYESVRVWKETQEVRFKGRYRPTGSVFRTAPDTLDHWLTERYCLYTATKPNNVHRLHVHHEQWPLQPAELEMDEMQMTQWLGIADLRGRGKPLLHFARSLDTVAWLPEKVTPE